MELQTRNAAAAVAAAESCAYFSYFANTFIISLMYILQLYIWLTGWNEIAEYVHILFLLTAE